MIHEVERPRGKEGGDLEWTGKWTILSVGWCLGGALLLMEYSICNVLPLTLLIFFMTCYIYLVVCRVLYL